MQYTTQDISPVKKKIAITVPAEEANAALAATIALYRTSVTLDGFRKGKAPSALIEKRFGNEIINEATTDLVNVHINEIISATSFAPVSRIDFDGGQLERDKEFTYSISFEVMPEFTLPEYAGFAVEQEEAVIDDNEVDSVVERLRQNLAEVTVVGESRNPKDGDIVVIDFQAYDENDKLIDGIHADNFQLPLGESQTLPDFETLIKGVVPGEKGEGPVAFPDDFFNPEFAGKTVTMKITLHSIKERVLPALDEAFAQKAGGFENMNALRDSIRTSYSTNRENLHKSAAQKSLLDSLLKLVEFPLPETMVTGHVNNLMQDVQEKLERQGKDLTAIGKTPEILRAEVLPEAEMRTRSHIFLLTAAKKEELTVSEQEVDLAIRRMAMQSGQDYNTIKDMYIKNNLLFALRDRLLADKAMDTIYSKATVTMVPPKAPTLSANVQV